MYKIDIDNGTIYSIDNTIVISPPYESPDYLDYARWVNAGNTPVEFSGDPGTAVPALVSRFQARAALYSAGYYDQINEIMATAPMIHQIAWNDASEFHRDSALVQSMSAALGLTSAQVDDLFRAASKIVI